MDSSLESQVELTEMLSKQESPCKVQENKQNIDTKLCKPKKKKKPKQAFPIPDFCKECREFVLNLKFHNKAVHGATCDLCLDVFDNEEKMEKHEKQFHKIKKVKPYREANSKTLNTTLKVTQIKQTEESPNSDKTKKTYSSTSSSSDLTPITPVSQKLGLVNFSGTDKNNNVKNEEEPVKKTKKQTSIMKFFKVQD